MDLEARSQAKYAGRPVLPRAAHVGRVGGLACPARRYQHLAAYLRLIRLVMLRGRMSSGVPLVLASRSVSVTEKIPDRRNQYIRQHWLWNKEIAVIGDHGFRIP